MVSVKHYDESDVVGLTSLKQWDGDGRGESVKKCLEAQCFVGNDQVSSL